MIVDASLFQGRYTTSILLGVSFGVFSRLLMLRTDYRQYPTYPHGKIIHISLSVIAAALGSVAVPSLFNKDFTAITFLSLAAQQFRDVRNMERQTLSRIDAQDLVPRGDTYIEGIAMVFEGRNYMVIFTSLMTTMFSVLFGLWAGVLAGAGCVALSQYLKSGKTLKKIADVEPSHVRVEGPNIYVDNIYIMNIGLEKSQELIRSHALGLIVTPKNKNSRVTIANLGQRQAMLHDLSTIMGVYRDSGEPSLVPMAKLDLDSGRLGVFILPTVKDLEQAAETLRRVPVLESAVRMPSEAKKKG